MTRRPLLVAHRGASARAPENTLEAFHLALDLCADGVELDVHETADGRFAVHHDPDLPAGPLRELPLARVRGRPAKYGGEVPSLADALGMMARRRPGYVVCVEVKGLRSWANLRRELSPWRDALHLEIQSFDIGYLREMAAAPDGHRLGVITQSPGPDPVALLDELGAVGLSVRHDAITAELAGVLHAAGKRLYAWTVNDAGRARELAAAGVDAVISDAPDVIGAGLRPR
ncbi:glycerophosphodiester phosphodiesterase [bacterium]|nr:glycerophosphodiester phosphodiesterase [bacterium]